MKLKILSICAQIRELIKNNIDEINIAPKMSTFKEQISICSFFAQKGRALGGWMDGWMDGCWSRFEGCIQHSKNIIIFLYNKQIIRSTSLSRSSLIWCWMHKILSDHWSKATLSQDSTWRGDRFGTTLAFVFLRNLSKPAGSERKRLLS